MIENLNDLKKLLQLCRKQGVTELEFAGVKLKLGDLPTEQSQVTDVTDNAVESDNPYANFPDGILSQEQLTYYSSGGDPSEDPELGALA